MKILIVGAGIGGLALAAFLKDSNIDYEIVEKAKDFGSQGYAICIWKNGRSILNKLGLGEVFDKNSFPAHDYRIHRGNGKLIRKYNLSKFYGSYGMAFSLVHRLDIHNWLMGLIDPSKVFLGTQVENISQSKDSVKVTLNNGTEKTYDLVVGADGIRSSLRKMVFNKEASRSSNWRVWYAWVDKKFQTKSTALEYISPNEAFSIFDVGEQTFAVVAAPYDGGFEVEGTVERLKVLFKQQKLLVPEILNNLKDSDISTSELIHVDLKTWVNNRVVLIGDAGHGFEPYAGIGGSMALEDGYVLAGELMQVQASYPLNTALKNFEKKRRGRVKIARRVTDKMKSWAMIKSPLIHHILVKLSPIVPEWYFTKDYHAIMREEI